MQRPGGNGHESLGELLPASDPALRSLVRIIERLDAVGIPWCVFGGLAVRFWGVRRAIADIDLLLKAELAQCMDLFPQATRVGSNGLQWARVELWCEPMCLQYANELVFMRFDREMQERRVRGPVAGKPIWVQSVEDIIVSKAILQRGGTKSDLQDLQSLLSLHAGRLDLGYLRDRARRALAEVRVVECLARLDEAGS